MRNFTLFSDGFLGENQVEKSSCPQMCARKPPGPSALRMFDAVLSQSSEGSLSAATVADEFKHIHKNTHTHTQKINLPKVHLHLCNEIWCI